jgi:hypothetical protein
MAAIVVDIQLNEVVAYVGNVKKNNSKFNDIFIK